MSDYIEEAREKDKIILEMRSLLERAQDYTWGKNDTLHDEIEKVLEKIELQTIVRINP